VRVDSIKRLLQHKPWRPVTIVVEGGERYRIRHPDNITWHKDELIIVTINGEWAIFEPVAVTAIRLQRKR
jgi:hypothetical protein